MRFIKKEEPKNSCLNRVRENNLEDIANDLKAVMASDFEDKPEKSRELGENYWKKLRSGCKKSVRQQMLKEQQYLCAYCERKIANETDAHIEHIKPKSRYFEKCFDYNNLIVSCNGNQCSDVSQEDYEENIHSCGHPKDHFFDEEKFLNPVELTDISDYFSYDIDEGRIEPSETDSTKADYMINLLNLDNPYLNNGRIKSKKALLKIVRENSKDKQGAIKIFKKLLNFNPPPAFISYLRYYFRHSFNENDSNDR